MNFTREERETIINFNEASDTANIYTRSAPVWRELEHKGFEATKTYGNDKPYAKEFEVAKGLISIRRPRTGRPLTAEQRLRAAKNLAKAREKKTLLEVKSHFWRFADGKARAREVFGQKPRSLGRFQ